MLQLWASLRAGLDGRAGPENGDRGACCLVVFFDVVLTSLVTVGVALLCISPLVSIAGYFETKQRIRRLKRDATEGVDLVHKELAYFAGLRAFLLPLMASIAVGIPVALSAENVLTIFDPIRTAEERLFAVYGALGLAILSLAICALLFLAYLRLPQTVLAVANTPALVVSAVATLPITAKQESLAALEALEANLSNWNTQNLQMTFGRRGESDEAKEALERLKSLGELRLRAAANPFRARHRRLLSNMIRTRPIIWGWQLLVAILTPSLIAVFLTRFQWGDTPKGPLSVAIIILWLVTLAISLSVVLFDWAVRLAALIVQFQWTVVERTRAECALVELRVRIEDLGNREAAQVRGLFRRVLCWFL